MRLVLCGVGGKSIAEAKRRISYEEFLKWHAYANEYGLPALGSEATERAFALLTWRVDRAAGGKSEWTDWLPQRQEEPTIQDIAKLMGARPMVKKNG